MISEMFWWAALGFGIGYWLSRSFKEIDNKIMKTHWFKRKRGFTAWIIKQLLNVFHHFQIGIIIIILSYKVGEPLRTFLWSFGAAMILDDIKDVPPRFRKHMQKVLG